MGFLGLLHLEIVRERLEREYNLHLLTTTPNVVYRITKTNGEVVVVKSPADYPEEEKIQKIEEPFVTASILTPKEYIGEIMKLSNQKRGVYKDMKFISVGRVELHYDFPLSEIIVDFFNLLKSATSGFASLAVSYTHLAGNTTALTFSWRVANLPLGVFSVAVITCLLYTSRCV